MLLKAEYKTRWKLESVLIIIISLIIVYNENVQDSSHLLSAGIIYSVWNTSYFSMPGSADTSEIYSWS